MKATILFCIMALQSLTSTSSTTCYSSLSDGFNHPQDSARTKVWWFFGETETTREGITADLEAFKQQGVGGVVYYDQVHGSGEGADKVFDAHWWQSLIFASQEAKRLGLTFEANIGNGYVAGGRWITPDRSMQRLAEGETLVASPSPHPEQSSSPRSLPQGGVKVNIGLPDCPRGWHHDVAVLALPYREELLGTSSLLNIEPTGRCDSALVFDFGRTFTARSISYEAKAQGKARTSSMQVLPFAPRTEMAKGETTKWNFFGCGYRELSNIGLLEVSDDGTHYRTVCQLRPRYQNLGGVKQQTISFPTTRGRYFRVVLTDRSVPVDNVVISARACVDNWEAKASLVSDFIDNETTPLYNKEEIVQVADIVDLTDRMTPDGMLTMPREMEGQWLVMRFVSVTTGGHTKHGRKEALGLECDKLSVYGARQHWQNYTKPLIDSIRAHSGALEGICMDSHEAGPQNWTQSMEQEFRRLRGYDIRPFLPTIAAGIIVSDSPLVLKDLRRTISDLITDRYYGEFNRLCRAEGLTLTAQAIGGALCMAGDAIEVKKLVDKPQAEFWGYQTEGNYDIKDCSSAAHVYGKQIASGEAYTDITYKHSLADIKNLADYAYCFGINELVVCAVAYQPWMDNRLSTANGRQYVLNRKNTLWPMSRPFWDYQARCSWLLRQGKPVGDVCIYLGDDVPVRILSHLLPDLPQGYDFDAFTTDALLHRMTAKDGRITLLDGVSYRMMILPANGQLSTEARQQIDQLRRQGVAIYDPQTDNRTLAQALQESGLTPDVEMPTDDDKPLYFCHRRTASEDIYFLNNHSDQAVSGSFRFNVSAASAELWNPVTGEKTALAITTQDGRTTTTLSLAPRESYFVVLSDNPSEQPVRQADKESVTTLAGSWSVCFTPEWGGAGTMKVETLNDWTKSEDPHIKYYSGTAIYQNTFTLKKDRRATYRLSLPLLNSAAEVIVNGRSAGIVWCSPWDVDITRQLKKGKNRIELRVCNTLWNRLAGDAMKPEAERLMWQTTPLAKPGDRLVPSGLAGEVTISEYR
jgi:hypothetical protein